MRRVFAHAIIAALLTAPLGARADEPAVAAPSQDQAAPANALKPSHAPKASLAPARGPVSAKAPTGTVATTANQPPAHLNLKLSTNRLSQVLDESGVAPVEEIDSSVETVEVTARRVNMEPITQGIPAIYYGITHPTEAWRIFLPIQP